MIGICFSISGIIFLSIFMVCFFSKNSIKSDETKLYGNLLIITFIGSLIDIFSFILYKMGVDVNSLLYTEVKSIIEHANVNWESDPNFFEIQIDN